VASVQNAIKTGKSVDEAVAAYKPSDRFKSYETDAERVKQNAAAIYAASKGSQ
jgi:hypothetical protein